MIEMETRVKICYVKRTEILIKQTYSGVIFGNRAKSKFTNTKSFAKLPHTFC